MKAAIYARGRKMKRTNIVYKIYFWVLIAIGVLTLVYFLKIFALLLGVPLALNEIAKAWR